MNRRAFLFASLAAASVPGVALGAPDIRVIYVGGADCPPCVQWKKTRQAGWVVPSAHTAFEQGLSHVA